MKKNKPNALTKVLIEIGHRLKTARPQALYGAPPADIYKAEKYSPENEDVVDIYGPPEMWDDNKDEEQGE